MPDSLPANLVTATLAAEDRRFEKHWGVDIRAVGGAIVNNYFKKRPSRGASTIAMQVARIQRGGGSGWMRKIQDAVTGIGLTARYGREKLLHQYFKIAPYGNRISGAACASRRYFHKPVQDLSFAEAALLAALPKAPSRLNLFNPLGMYLAKQRAALVIRHAYKYGTITSQVRDESLAELNGLSSPIKDRRQKTNFHFLQECERKVSEKFYPRGEIRTTLDLNIQDTLQSMLKKEVPKLLEWQAGNSASMVVDVKTAQVLAYVGSADYFDPKGGAIDCAKLPRSTGSLLKPFIYAMGMEWAGYTPATILTDLGHDFGSGNRSFIPENADHKFMGPVLYKNALANSRNIPAVSVLKAVGIDLFYRLCIALGLTPDDGKSQLYGLGLSIGGLYCSMQQLSTAYLTLAHQGEKQNLVWEITNPSLDPAKQILSPEVSMQVLRFLSDPVARLPSFPRGGNLEYPFPVAVKTGTSEGFRDSWCIGMSERYLIAVWIGNTDFSPTKGLTGYEGAARLVKKMFYSLQSDLSKGLDDIEYTPPPKFVPVSICRLTGKRADHATPYVTTEYFRPGTEPLEFSTVQQLLPVDKQNGLLAYPGCSVAMENRRFTVLAPQYRDWAESQGLEVPPDRYSPRCGGAPVVNEFQVAIQSPRSGSRVFIDPEMPMDKSILPILCRVFPPPNSILWLVDKEEFREVKYPFTLLWNMKPGTHTFQAIVPGTPFRSESISVEVF